MAAWVETAIELLENSLIPVPKELNEIDWKTDISDNSQRLAEHISAFANTQNGGFFAFNIDNNGTINDISKDDVDKIVDRIGNIARNNLSASVAIDHAVIEYKGKNVLFVYVPENNDKPVHIRGNDIMKSFRRSAGQTVKLSKSEVKHLISISTGTDFESQIAGIGFSDEEVLVTLDYASFFELLQKRMPSNKDGILDVLKDEKLIVKSNDTWNITNLGAILFAHKIKSFNGLGRKSVRVIVYKGVDRINAITEDEGGKGYAIGFQGLVSHVMSKLPTNEVIETALRKKVKMYPEIAMREFIANAIIHQDFSEAGSGVMIEIFEDRIEITNPGIPLVDVERFIDTAPKSRNESLAYLMRRLNICEERGSGVDRAIDAIESFHLPAPKIIKGANYTRIIVYSHRPLLKMDKEDRIRACYQHTVLNYISEKVVNNQSVRERFNINKNHPSIASKIISDTIEAGKIKLADPDSASKKFATYVPSWH